jgi:hypothetical protein
MNEKLLLATQHGTGAMPNVVHSRRAIFNDGSERPVTKSLMRDGLTPIAAASCLWVIILAQIYIIFLKNKIYVSISIEVSLIKRPHPPYVL